MHFFSQRKRNDNFSQWKKAFKIQGDKEQCLYKARREEPSCKLNRRKGERNDGSQTCQAHFSYLIVMVARTKENSLVRSEVQLVERLVWMITYAPLSTTLDANDAPRYNDVHWCYEARNSFQESFIVGEKMFAHTWLRPKGKYCYHLIMLGEDVCINCYSLWII